jgi:hypothetical protein
MATLVALEEGTEPVIVAFTAQEMLAAAQGNIMGLILASARYCMDRGLSFEEWVESMGRLHAPLWDRDADRSPLHVARRVALCLVSAGARHVSVAGDESRAEVSCRWPDEGRLAFFGLTRAEIRASLRDTAAQPASSRPSRGSWTCGSRPRRTAIARGCPLRARSGKRRGTGERSRAGHTHAGQP